MKHTYIYGLMIGLLVLAGCAKKPANQVRHDASGVVITATPREQLALTKDAPPPPPKATWLHSASEAGIYRTGNPYKVNGVWHFPQKELDPNHDEIGEATWYGHDFHNKMTANGEIFDMHGFTAAHKTLPLPSVVRVTNLSNKKSVILRVNDRGPFDNKRVIDVSKKAAELLGFLDQGSTKVRVQVLPEESLRVASMTKGTNYDPNKLTTQAGQVNMTPLPATTSMAMTPTPVATMPKPEIMESVVAPENTDEEAPLTPPSIDVLNSLLPQTEAATPAGSEESVTPDVTEPAVVASAPIAKGTVYIQAGAYRNKANAENAVKKLQKVAPAELSAMSKDTNPLYRVRVGPFPDKDTARQKLKAVISIGHADATVVG